MVFQANNDEIHIGDAANFSKTISEYDIYSFAGITGDFNPIHIDGEYAGQTVFGERIAHGMLIAGLFSNVIGNRLIGPGSIYLGQELVFKAPVRIGDTITATCRVIEKREDKPIYTLETIATNQNNEVVLSGKATVIKKP